MQQYQHEINSIFCKINESYTTKILSEQIDKFKSLSTQLLQPMHIYNLTCSIMILENLADPEWMSAPCNVRMIEDVICVENKTDENKNVTQFINIKQKLPTKYHGMIHIYPCKDGGYISSSLLCDGSENCPGGEDEQMCYCYKGSLKVTDFNFCSKVCLAPICTCPTLLHQLPTGGCAKYAEDKHQMETSLKDFQNENVKNQTDLVNDLIPDLPDNKDEKELLDMLSTNKHRKNKCISKFENPCFLGHSKCYYKGNKCVYELDANGYLKFCRNGAHLEDCVHMSCAHISKFKCSRSYCVPFGYVCDGKVDCPSGEDEMSCGAKICVGFLHCVNSSQCVHLNDVCDGNNDCHLADDETFCSLKKDMCPVGCKCLGLAVECDQMKITNLMALQMFSHMIFVSITNSPEVANFTAVKFPSNALFYIYTRNFLIDLSNILESHPTISDLPTKLLDVSNNILKSIGKDQLQPLWKLVTLNMSLNQIDSVSDFSFTRLGNLQLLDLSFNQIRRVSSFLLGGLKVLASLKIVGNYLHEIDVQALQHSPKIKEIITDNYRLCCVKPSEATKCHALMEWPASCDDLISNQTLRTGIWLVFILILATNVTNFLCLFYFRNKQKVRFNCFQAISVLVNVSDLACGLYMTVISAADLVYKGSFSVKDLLWRTHILCYTAAAIFIFFQISSLSVMLFMTFSRLMVVQNPFKTRFRNTRFVFKYLVIIYILISMLSIGLMILFIKTQKNSALPNSLCNVFYDTTGSTLSNVLVILLAGAQIAVTISIFVLYLFLIINIRKASGVLSSTNVFKMKDVVFQILLLTGSNILCWIPSAIIYLLSFYLKNYPKNLMTVTTILIIPINSIINPILIASTNHRSKSSFTFRSYSSYRSTHVFQTTNVQAGFNK